MKILVDKKNKSSFLQDSSVYIRICPAFVNNCCFEFGLYDALSISVCVGDVHCNHRSLLWTF